MKTLIKILYNQSNDTYHPILYRWSPLPGNPENIHRFKSFGHHTTGFKTLDEAKADTKSESMLSGIRAQGTIPLYKTDDLILWDGEGIPTDIQLLGNEDIAA